MKNKLVITGFIFAVLLSVMVVGVAQANPLPPTWVTVCSPKNDQIYSSSTVQLSFIPIHSDDINFTSFTYVLDEQSLIATNGNATLTNLPSGLHTLKIYCSYNIYYFNRTYEFLNRTYEYKDQIANVVYFNTQYSIPWITFTIITVSAATILPSVLFFKRRQIKARLMRKKTWVFWLGTFLLVSGTLALVPFAWKATMDSLFPYWPRGVAVSLSFYFPFIGALIFIVGVGLVMMWIGTRNGKSLDKANDERKYLFG